MSMSLLSEHRGKQPFHIHTHTTPRGGAILIECLEPALTLADLETSFFLCCDCSFYTHARRARLVSCAHVSHVLTTQCDTTTGRGYGWWPTVVATERVWEAAGGGGCKFRHVHQCMRAAPSRSGQVRLPAALEAGFETGGARRPSERNVVGVVGEGQQE